MSKPLALSVKIIVKDSDDRILVMKRSANSKNNPGKWDFPGGKIDPGETFDRALVRETAEETGLDVFIEGIAGTTQSESPTNRIVYLIMEGYVQSGEFKLSDEHDDYMWVHVRELVNVDLCEQFSDFAKSYSS